MLQALFGLLVSGLLVRRNRDRRDVRAGLLRLSRRLGGRISSRKFGSAGRVTFEAEGGVPAEVATVHHPGWTRLRFRWLPPGALRIGMERRHADGRYRLPRGSRDLRLGIDAFDRRFHVIGVPEAWARQTLTPTVQAALSRLAEVGLRPGEREEVRLHLGPQGLTILVPRSLVGEDRDLDAFVADGRAIFSELVRTAAGSLTVLASATGATDAECPVCGEALETESRQCAECHAPHHPDCWDYFGGCAIYACGSTAIVAPPEIDEAAADREHAQ